jgi:hypothetical protein
VRHFELTREALTDLLRDVFFWTVGSYVIAYRKSDPLLIVAALHGKRNIKNIMRNR